MSESGEPGQRSGPPKIEDFSSRDEWADAYNSYLEQEHGLDPKSDAGAIVNKSTRDPKYWDKGSTTIRGG